MKIRPEPDAMTYIIRSILLGIDYVHGFDMSIVGLTTAEIAVSADGEVRLCDACGAIGYHNLLRECGPVFSTHPPRWCPPEAIQYVLTLRFGSVLFL